MDNDHRKPVRPGVGPAFMSARLVRADGETQPMPAVGGDLTRLCRVSMAPVRCTLSTAFFWLNSCFFQLSEWTRFHELVAGPGRIPR